MSKSDDPSEPKKSNNQCQVCGDNASINNYGALSCLSCRTFFRRNAFPTREPPVCRYDGQCEVNMLTRKVCTACRLKKCLAVGMSPDLIRKEDLCATKRKSTSIKFDQDTRLITRTTMNVNDPQLSSSEQMLITNINFAFDTFSPIDEIQQLIEQLNPSSINFQYDLSQTLGIITKFYYSLEFFIRSIPDFKILTPSEQKSLFERNMLGIFSLGKLFFLYQSKFFQTIENERLLLPLYGHDRLQQAKYICQQFHSDTIIFKLLLVALAFSSNGYILDKQSTMSKDSLLLGTFRLLGSQNVYVELIWKYLIRQSNHFSAVQRFSRLIKQILDVLQFSMDLYETNTIYRTFIDDLIASNEDIFVPLWGKI